MADKEDVTLKSVIKQRDTMMAREDQLIRVLSAMYSGLQVTDPRFQMLKDVLAIARGCGVGSGVPSV